MATVINRYEIEGLPAAGGDAVASVTFSPPSFQAGQAVTDAFLDHVRAFIAAQQGVATVVVTQVATVTSQV